MKIRNVLAGVVALAALCVAQNGYASFQHKIENGTKYNVRYSFKYASAFCGDEGNTLAPEKTEKWGAGVCSLKRVEATVLDVPTNPKPGEVVSSNKTNVKAVPYVGPYSANGTWIISGPVNGVFSVSRKVQ